MIGTRTKRNHSQGNFVATDEWGLFFEVPLNRNRNLV